MSRLLLIDIETSPIVGYVWDMYETNVIKKIKPFTILSFAYKWIGKKTKVVSCEKISEKNLLEKLHSLLSSADTVLAHNGDSFDIKKINARFIVHKFQPPSPFKTIDTKKEAKKIASFDSHSLENLGIDLSEGEKIKHRGFSMWEGCMNGNRIDWKDMRRYNKHDVDLLEKVYLRIQCWIKNHPTTNQNKTSCPNCDSKKTQKRGLDITRKSKYQRFQCMSCGAWFKGERIK